MEVRQDPVLKGIIAALQTDSTSKPGYELKGGILFYIGRLAIPAASLIIDTLLMDFHSSPSGGHSRYVRIVCTEQWQGHFIGM